jgi:molybdate transport system substrate-binding protein
MKKSCAILLALLMLFGFAACGAPGESPSPLTDTDGSKAAQTELLVSAAASLTDALNEVVENYTAANPHMKITVNYGASGALQSQIENGAPADIFFSAAAKQMNALNDAGLMVSDSIVTLLKNEIVLVVPKTSALTLSSFEDAAGDTVKSIALGDTASVPAGQYAQETFTALGVWDAVNAKAVFGSDVKQVLSWVAAGDADCGVVYSTDAAADRNVKAVATAPAGTHKDIAYPVGIVKASTQQEAAAGFLSYLQSDEGLAIFSKYGFLAG